MTETNPDKPETIQQASAIPFRRQDDETQFCLITSIRKGNWGFPKGIIDPGETAEETALKEAEEEAGIHGRIIGAPLGSYDYAKWDTTLHVVVMLMEVTRTDAVWYEADVRERCWTSAEKARDLLSRGELIELLEKAVERIDKRPV